MMLGRDKLYISAYEAQEERHKTNYNWGILYTVIATIFPPVNAIYTFRVRDTWEYSKEFSSLAKMIAFGILGSLIPGFSTYYARKLSKISLDDNKSDDVIVKVHHTSSKVYNRHREEHKQDKQHLETTNNIKLTLDKTNKPKKIVINNSDGSVDVYMDKQQQSRRISMSSSVYCHKHNPDLLCLIKNKNTEWYQQSYKESQEMVENLERKFNNS